jgi:hypothetical protein
MTPKPRREGQRGGMNHTGSQARSSRRGGDPGGYGGPPKTSCAVLLFITPAIPAVILTATGGLIL